MNAIFDDLTRQQWDAATGSGPVLDQIVFHWNRRKADTETRLADIFMARSTRLRFRDCVA
jgi:hypothetical protein